MYMGIPMTHQTAGKAANLSVVLGRDIWRQVRKIRSCVRNDMNNCVVESLSAYGIA